MCEVKRLHLANKVAQIKKNNKQADKTDKEKGWTCILIKSFMVHLPRSYQVWTVQQHGHKGIIF